MKALAISITTAVLAVAPSVSFAQVSNCAWTASDIDRITQDSSSAVSRLESESRSLSILPGALEDAARKVGSGSAVDVSGSLAPLVSEIRSKVQTASQSLSSGLATLRRTAPDNEGLGSKVRPMA